MITVSNVSKVYQSLHAVRDLSLTIPSGRIYGIIGKSGAGKSTLVRLLCLLERPDGGTIHYNDERVDNLTGMALLERRRRVGMIFQNFNLFYSRNVFGNIAYPMEITGVPKAHIQEKVRSLLALVGLADKELSPISKLSGGQMQRVAIARALANDPEILFCDEATSALDPQTTLSILQLIKDIQKKLQLTVVMITHQMEVVREACDYVSVLDSGSIIESGTVKDIFSFPKTDLAREFLSGLRPVEKEVLDLSPSHDVRYRLHFIGNVTTKPVLSELIRTYNVDVNILSGTIHTVENEPIGELVVEISGTENNIAGAKEWLNEKRVRVEVLDD